MAALSVNFPIPSIAYLSAQKDVARGQIEARKALLWKSLVSFIIVVNPDLATDEAKALAFLFCSMLNEKQRRLYAGLESFKLGHGGDAHIASISGMNPHSKVSLHLPPDSGLCCPGFTGDQC
jgi:hypothetical protein